MVALVLAALAGGGRGDAAPNDPEFSRQWGLVKIGAETAWQTGTGKGTTIAVVDTGVDLAHEDLAGKLADRSTWKDFVADDANPQDENGHGTHVAGIAAAATGNGRGVAGTAPDARIMPVRVLDETGNGNGADVSAGIRWAVDHGAHVINLSLSGVTQPIFGPSFDSALKYAWRNGVICVVAAGNNYILSSGYEDDPALVVSATNRRDQKPDFSSGVGEAKWGIAAPGGGSTLEPEENDIYSTYWNGDRPNRYEYAAGTSMSAPHAAGAAAVLRSLGLSAQETVDRLLATAVDVGPPGEDSTFGHGRLDLARAVEGLGPKTGGPAGGPGSGPSPAASKPVAGSGASPAPKASATPVGDGPAASSPSAPAGAGDDESDGRPPPKPAGSTLLVALGLLGGAGAGLGVALAWLKRRARG